MDLGRATVHSVLDRMDRGLISNIRPSLHGHIAFARRMRLTSVLHGHTGCVNRLALSQDSKLLLSGSDDCWLRLWSIDSPTSVSSLAAVKTDHSANIFGVAFMPDTDNNYVISGGLDCEVRHSHVETAHCTLWTCHNKRVRTVSPLSSNTFISASRDGTACLFDVRVPPSTPPPVIVSLTNRYGDHIQLSCAIPSPVASHHLLVAAMEYYIRVIDIRFASTATRNSSSAVPCNAPRGNCIETFCPPHLHNIIPDQCMMAADLHRAMPTYANFSPDGSQIVASYFDDAVVVFDRPSTVNPIFCRPPHMTTTERQASIWHFCNTAALKAFCKTSDALGAANRALELEPANLMALLFKAKLLIDREGPGDFRTAYASLQLIIDTLREDPYQIVMLWGRHKPHGPLAFPKNWRSWRQKAEIWIIICNFYQAHCLFQMIPRVYESVMFNSDFYERERRYIRRRLEYLDILCSNFIRYRATSSSASTTLEWRTFALARALGSGNEREELYGSHTAAQRCKVLTSIVDGFLNGIDQLREYLQDGIQCLQSDNQSRISRLGRPYYRRDINRQSESCNNSERDERWTYRSRNRRNGRTGQSDVNVQPMSSDLVDDPIELWGSLTLHDRVRCYHGHTSRYTDIKEANFFGAHNQVVMSGSDDTNVYLWSATTGEVLSRVRADRQIVNCVLGHPTYSMILASGIDDSVKVLTPQTGTQADLSDDENDEKIAEHW